MAKRQEALSGVASTIKGVQNSRPTSWFSRETHLGPGKVVEVAGPPGSGRTMGVLALLKGVSGPILWVDTDVCFSRDLAQEIGVPNSMITVAHPLCGEEAASFVIEAAQIVEVIVIDSIPAMTPKSILDGKSDPPLRARLLAQMLHSFRESNPTAALILTNQLRTAPRTYGDNNQPTAETVLYSFANTRLSVERAEKAKRGAGYYIHMSVVKDEVIPPGTKLKLEALWDEARA